MGTKPLIMVIEDEKAILEFISTKLETEKYRVISVNNGKEALNLIPSHCPDLILLDLGLPDIDGMEILKSIRSWSSLPVIVVSARQHESDIISSLDNGADDYVTKPFSNAVLMARIRNALRKNITKKDGNSAVQSFNSNNLKIDYEKRLVTAFGENIHMTPIEYKIITILAQNCGCVITYNSLCREVWGPYSGDNRTLRVNMANLRRKIEKNPADPVIIQTEVGVGYRMIECD